MPASECGATWAGAGVVFWCSPRYERATFEKALRTVPGKPEAAFLAPGHPLLDATLDAVITRYGELFRRGAILIDPADLSETPRVLLTIEHSIQDARPTRDGGRRVVSRRLQFVEIDANGVVRPAGYAPYLDYRGATESELGLLAPILDEPWLQVDLDEQARSYAIAHLVPEHFQEAAAGREELVVKTLVARCRSG